MHICSGCDNECEIGEQYCLECLREIAQDDWIEANEEPDVPPYCDDCGSWLDGFGVCRNYNCAASPDLGKNWI